MNALLSGSSGSITARPKSENEQFRVGNGTAFIRSGSPRQIEFGMRLVF